MQEVEFAEQLLKDELELENNELNGFNIQTNLNNEIQLCQQLNNEIKDINKTIEIKWNELQKIHFQVIILSSFQFICFICFCLYYFQIYVISLHFIESHFLG